MAGKERNGRGRRDLALPLAVAFLSGWAIMQLEIIGGRMLAPYFGYSIYQWGALIGVVMSALALGYAWGGHVGDRPQARRFLLWALAGSATYALAMPYIADPALRFSSELGPAWGAVAASAALLGIPSILLATTSPIVIRLTATARIAGTAGRVYTVGTVGSIGGTFFTSFFVIPELGSRMGLYVGAAMIVAGLACLAATADLPRRRWAAAAATAALLLALGYPRPPAPGREIVWRTESPHNLVEVHDYGDTRVMYLNSLAAAQTIERKGKILTGEYYDYFLLAPRLNGARKILVLGVAGGVAIKQLVRSHPDVEVTGVDLDPEVLRAARAVFELDRLPRTTLVAADARRFLAESTERWDAIVVDLYNTGHIPFFVATEEFYALVRARLTADGIVLANVYSPRGGQELIGPVARTLKRSFADVHLMNAGNVVALAWVRPTALAEARARLEREPYESDDVFTAAGNALATLRVPPGLERWPVLTDDRTDIEFRSFRARHAGRE